MGRIVLLLFILLLRSFAGFCQSVLEKTRDVIKNNKPRSLYSIPVADRKRALLICLHQDSTVCSLSPEAIKLTTDTLAMRVRDSAIADSVDFYDYVSIFYRQDKRSEFDERLTYVYKMTDKIFVRRKRKR